ncbi:MAG: DUF5679 domain-containing protein [Phototrophicaceae bacterium]|jgi:hypothetical protein
MTLPDNANPLENRFQGYCVRCKHSVDMEAVEAVWTSRGTPGLRGTCPECSGTVFRMGASPLHEGLPKPAAINVHQRKRNFKLPPNTLYINYADVDEALAQQLADDFKRYGMNTWMHDATPAEVNWAGGVHPALKDCPKMLLILSAPALAQADIENSWNFFRDKGKPIVIALAEPVEPPDALRRSPRFDFSVAGDYKAALRAAVQALAR